MKEENDMKKCIVFRSQAYSELGDEGGGKPQNNFGHPDWSLLVNEQSEEPIILRDGRQFPGEGLTNDEWKSHLSLEPIGSMLTKCMSSQTRFSAQIQARQIL